jgi:hypothetical protein
LSAKGLELQTRDLEILRLVHRFRFCLGRHIKTLCGFEGARATDRRLKKLFEAGYLTRKKYLYGIPYLYTLSHKGRVLLGVSKREDKIRVDRIAHDTHVLDAVVFFCLKHGVSFAKIESEKELHIRDGFGIRKHQPDFVVNANDYSKRIAVEIELSPKPKDRMEENIRENYLKYDKQIWITNNSKVKSLLQIFAGEYSNIEVWQLEDVLAYVGH